MGTTSIKRTVKLDTVKCICPSSGMDVFVESLIALLATSITNKTEFVELSTALAVGLATGGTLLTRLGVR